ncbi:MAG: M48 family metallopeptidase [Gemmatimonadota bacterium]
MSAGSQLGLFDVVEAGVAPAAKEPAGEPFLEGLPRSIPAEGVELRAYVEGAAVACLLRRSARARRVRLIVERSGRLTVVLPRRCPVQEVPEALREHARWLARTLERQRRRCLAPRPIVADGRVLRVLGREHVLRIPSGEPLGAMPRVVRTGNEISVRVPPLHRRSPAEMLRSWLRVLASREIPPRVHGANQPLGFPLARVSVRDQRTKWGACSSRGNVSVNWRLLLAPPEVLDYVIVHELCHLRELNHSAEFWALLRSVLPDYEAPRSWLREQGESLDL